MCSLSSSLACSIDCQNLRLRLGIAGLGLSLGEHMVSRWFGSYDVLSFVCLSVHDDGNSRDIDFSYVRCIIESLSLNRVVD